MIYKNSIKFAADSRDVRLKEGGQRVPLLFINIKYKHLIIRF